MTKFSSDMTKNSLFIMQHHTALFLCSIQENRTPICLQRIPINVYIFHFGNNVTSRKLGVTRSFIHSLTYNCTRTVLRSTCPVSFLQTQRKLQHFTVKGYPINFWPTQDIYSSPLCWLWVQWHWTPRHFM